MDTGSLSHVILGLDKGSTSMDVSEGNESDPATNTAHDLEWALTRLEELVRLESPSLDRAASLCITDSLAAGFEAVGGRVTAHDFDGGRHLVVDVPGARSPGAASPGTGSPGAAQTHDTPGDAPLLLVGHSDTVWANGTLEQTLPWSRDAATVHGPGVFDMKSGLVVIEAALARVPEERRRPVRVLVTADEEVGSPDGKTLIPRVLQGVRGALGFESPHPDGALKVGRRGSTRVMVRVQGVEAHAALDPERGVSAITELLAQLGDAQSLVTRVSGTGPEVLLNIGTISGGTRANVTAGSARAELGLRFQDSTSEREVLSALVGATAHDRRATVTTEVLSHRTAWAPDEGDRALLAEVADAARSLGRDVSGCPAAGASDLNQVGASGVPAVDGLGPRGGGAHALTEHVDIASFAERIDLLAALLTVSDD